MRCGDRKLISCHDELQSFLADRTNGRAIGTVLCLSVCLSVCLSSVCDVMYCG